MSTVAPKACTAAEPDEGPGSFQYTSTVCVWPGQPNLALHVFPQDLNQDSLPLGPVTRAAYHALESVQTALQPDAGFVMVHFVPSTSNVHVTMMPVGPAHERACLDKELKNGANGFTSLVRSLAVHARDGCKYNQVSVLYNTPEDLASTSSNIAIVHELDIMRGPSSQVANFIDLVMPVQPLNP